MKSEGACAPSGPPPPQMMPMDQTNLTINQTSLTHSKAKDRDQPRCSENQSKLNIDNN